MNLRKLASRFLLPGLFKTLYFRVKYHALVSPRAEVDVTSNLSLGKGAVISAFCKVKAADGRLDIGPRVDVGSGSFISSRAGGITIGADTLVGPNSVIVASNYRYGRLDIPVRKQGHTSSGIEIGEDVWIGANTVILDGAKIGSQAIINAGSVVSGEVPPRTIVAGNPAKVVFERR